MEAKPVRMLLDRVTGEVGAFANENSQDLRLAKRLLSLRPHFA